MLRPLSNDKWNYEMAAHLLNRAGFGGPPSQIQPLADLSHDKAISYLLDYETIPDPTPEHLEFYRQLLASKAPKISWPRKLEKNLRKARKGLFGSKAGGTTAK